MKSEKTNINQKTVHIDQKMLKFLKKRFILKDNYAK